MAVVVPFRGCARCIVLGLPPGAFRATRNIGAKAAPSASIHIEPVSHKLGNVIRDQPGGTLDVRTTVRNDGSRTLNIISIQLSCTCTKAFLERDELRPGETTILTARLSLGDSPEPRRSYIVINSNDPKHPRATVEYEWRIVNPLRTSPESAAFGRISPGEIREIELEILFEGLPLCSRCQVVAEADSAPVSAQVRPDKDLNLPLVHRSSDRQFKGRYGQLRVQVRASLEPTDFRHAVLLKVTCGGSERGRLILPVSWSVDPVVTIAPSRLVFGPSRGGAHVSGTIVARSTQKKPFRILRVRCDNNDVPVNAKYDEELSVQHVVLVSPIVPIVPGPWRAVLVIETDHEGARSLQLPVSGVAVSM